MRSHFDLWSHDEVSANADRISAVLQAGRMPCDRPWPASQVDLPRRWIDGGNAR
jgi:hypothetical protein